jgi:hypothetical protein
MSAELRSRMAGLGPSVLTSRRGCGLKAKRFPTRSSVARLQRLARERADAQARRVPWRCLHDTRKHYVEWQEFCLWVRSIVETDDRMPEWLSAIVDQRCPGFLQTEPPASSRRLALGLENWVDEHVFAFAKDEGWFDAVVYYAIRDPQYQRAEVCWSECASKWAQARPNRYPSFREWQTLAAACDETAHLVPEQRKAQTSAKLVARDRLEQAIARYIDWEALGYWSRPALERGAPIPDEVRQELELRCPGFLAQSAETAAPKATLETLMIWIADQFFADAKAEGWFDAIILGVRRHPRAIRIMEYADHCDEVRGPDALISYSTFTCWCKAADLYVEPASV